MPLEAVKTRLEAALHRGHRKATEEELADVAAVVLAVTAELTAELAGVIADLEARVHALETRPS